MVAKMSSVSSATCWMPSPLNFIRNSSICPEPLLDSSFSGMRMRAVGRGHRLAGEAGVFALDVEVADLAEVEQPLVVLGPERHAAAVHVVRQVVDDLQPVARRMARHAGHPFEVDVVDALAVFEAVDQVQRRAADALDRRQPQLHRPGGDLDRLRAELERARIGLVRILDAKRQRTRARAVLGREVAGQALRFAVDDEIDVALAVQQHVLAAVLGHQREAELLETAAPACAGWARRTRRIRTP